MLGKFAQCLIKYGWGDVISGALNIIMQKLYDMTNENVSVKKPQYKRPDFVSMWTRIYAIWIIIYGIKYYTDTLKR